MMLRGVMNQAGVDMAIGEDGANSGLGPWYQYLIPDLLTHKAH